MRKLLDIGSMKWPLQSATRGFGFIGKRGSGKSYAGADFAEELFKAGIPFVVFDPIDVWWGLKVSSDGKGKGLPIVVFGKEHADIPLDRTMGRKIADAFVQHNISCVISTFGMNKTEMREVIGDFSERLLQINNRPRQVLIEEAHEVVPQRVMGAMAKCFSAVEALLVMGRNRGIGVTLLNQRMATLNKDLLTQIDVLVAFRSVGPQDRNAFRDWVEVHNVEGDEKFDEFMRSVPQLPTGEAWVWSPEFLEKFERVKFRKRRTFHPDREKLGVTFKMPKIQQGDVQSFIDSFTKKPEKPKPVGGVTHAAHRHVEIAFNKKEADRIRNEGYKEGWTKGVQDGKAEAIKAQKATMARLGRFAKQALVAIEGIESIAGAKIVDVATVKVKMPVISRAAPVAADSIGEAGDGKLSIGARMVLSYLHGESPDWKSKPQMWIGARYSPGGGFDHMVSELLRVGLIEKEGTRKYRSVEPVDESLLVPDFDKSVSNWDKKLSRGAQKVFHLLLENPDSEYTKIELGEICGYAQGGGFDHIISELTSKTLAVRVDRAYRVSKEVLDL